MEKYLKAGIKSTIDSFPEVGRILEKHGIGCVPCTVGTCKLEDVVKIHALPPQTLAELMYFVEKAIHPDRKIPKPVINVAATPVKIASKTIRYSPPLKWLVDEHVWITRLLAVVPELTRAMRSSGKIDRDLVLKSVDFIRGYADRFHHMKEEEILFDYTDKNADIIKVIFQDHDKGRGFIRLVVEGLEKIDLDQVCINLENYRELLTEHIKKEDEVLYPFIDRDLTTKQIGEMFSQFNEVESKTSKDVPQKYLEFIVSIEKKFIQKKFMP